MRHQAVILCHTSRVNSRNRMKFMRGVGAPEEGTRARNTSRNTLPSLKFPTASKLGRPVGGKEVRGKNAECAIKSYGEGREVGEGATPRQATRRSLLWSASDALCGGSTHTHTHTHTHTNLSTPLASSKSRSEA